MEKKREGMGAKLLGLPFLGWERMVKVMYPISATNGIKARKKNCIYSWSRPGRWPSVAQREAVTNAILESTPDTAYRSLCPPGQFGAFGGEKAAYLGTFWGPAAIFANGSSLPARAGRLWACAWEGNRTANAPPRCPSTRSPATAPGSSHHRGMAPPFQLLEANAPNPAI